MSVDTPDTPPLKRSAATRFVLRGLAIILPPVLTFVILAWVARGINDYVIQPINTVVRFTIAQAIQEIKPVDKLRTMPGLPPLPFYNDTNYYVTLDEYNKLQQQLAARRDASAPDEDRADESKPAIRLNWLDLEDVYIPFGNKAVPYRRNDDTDYYSVAQRLPPAEIPTSAIGLYMEIVTHRHFYGVFHLSAVAIIIAVALMYFLGRFVTARLGSWIVNKVERHVLANLPVVRNIYSSVKQVTDFVLSEHTVEYNRVVAVEYPRRGMWSLGFVTGDSLMDIAMAAAGPCVSVLIPSSPMPVTGYTINVPRRDIVDVNLTIDQAFQFCVSCGVLVPPQQVATPEGIRRELAKRLTETSSTVMDPRIDGRRSDEETAS